MSELIQKVSLTIIFPVGIVGNHKFMIKKIISSLRHPIYEQTLRQIVHFSYYFYQIMHLYRNK